MLIFGPETSKTSKLLPTDICITNFLASGIFVVQSDKLTHFKKIILMILVSISPQDLMIKKETSLLHIKSCSQALFFLQSISTALSQVSSSVQRPAYVQGCPTFRRLWTTPEEEELSWATHELHKC